MVLKELRREFSPEFINRIDEVIVFNPLGLEQLRAIGRLLSTTSPRRSSTGAHAPRERARGRLALKAPATTRTPAPSPTARSRGTSRTRYRNAHRVPRAIECVEVTVEGDELKVQIRAPEPVGTGR